MSDLHRKGFGLKANVQLKLLEDFHHSDVVRFVKTHGFRLERGGLTLLMAREMGFCYGVERTLQYAYETVEKFPDRNIYITDEIIHNAQVNERLISLGMKFLNGKFACGTKLAELGPGDVVIIPAFGVTVDELTRLRERGCVLVDTTCGSVLNVWKNVERYAREAVTAIVHGKYQHEETRATVSQVAKYPGGRYLVLRDLEETAIVAEYIRHGGDAAAFAAKFAKAASPGFDPDRDLSRIGLANQTTMMCSESLEVERVLRRAMADRFGEGEMAAHFIAFDTICSATQDRQDAALEMLRSFKFDLVLVIGGFNSSNTGHLAEMAATCAPTYHVENASCLASAQEIVHRCPRTGGTLRTGDWLPAGEAAIGITAGASTPDNIVGRVIERLFEIRGCPLADLVPATRGESL